MNYEDDIEDLSTLASSEQYLGYFKSLKLLEEWTEQLLEREKIIASAHSTLEFGINTLLKLLEQIVQILETTAATQPTPIPSTNPPKTVVTPITKKPLLLHNIQTLYVHEE